MKVEDQITITLDDFIKRKHDEVDRFKARWLERNKEDPAYYPITMRYISWKGTYYCHGSEE